tara:strand:- start:1156 stop:2145 length:990 start_codon:yes stop_codon:yes gene_type:complete
MEIEDARLLFRDISVGVSKSYIDKDLVYVKHFSTHDQVEYNEVYKEHLKTAVNKGVPTERESLDFQIDQGFWHKEDDLFIERQTEYIANLVNSKKALYLKSSIDAHNETVKAEREKLNEKLKEKEEIIGHTAERFAASRANDFYILNSFFKDKRLNDPVFTNEDIIEIDAHSMSKYIMSYNKITEQFSEKNIKLLILQDFFYIYFPFCEDPVSFFGKPIVELTDNQLKTIVYTRIYKNIFERYDNIPEKIRKDPDALLDFGNASDSAREKAKDDLTNPEAGASTIMGATQEDLEYLGVESKKSDKSLHEEAEKKGGSLSMKDLMDLHGL